MCYLVFLIHIPFVVVVTDSSFEKQFNTLSVLTLFCNGFGFSFNFLCAIPLASKNQFGCLKSWI